MILNWNMILIKSYSQLGKNMYVLQTIHTTLICTYCSFRPRPVSVSIGTIAKPALSLGFETETSTRPMKPIWYTTGFSWKEPFFTWIIADMPRLLIWVILKLLVLQVPIWIHVFETEWKYTKLRPPNGFRIFWKWNDGDWKLGCLHFIHPLLYV